MAAIMTIQSKGTAKMARMISDVEKEMESKSAMFISVTRGFFVSTEREADWAVTFLGCTGVCTVPSVIRKKNDQPLIKEN